MAADEAYGGPWSEIGQTLIVLVNGHEVRSGRRYRIADIFEPCLRLGLGGLGRLDKQDRMMKAAAAGAARPQSTIRKMRNRFSEITLHQKAEAQSDQSDQCDRIAHYAARLISSACARRAARGGSRARRAASRRRLRAGARGRRRPAAPRPPAPRLRPRRCCGYSHYCRLRGTHVLHSGTGQSDRHEPTAPICCNSGLLALNGRSENYTCTRIRCCAEREAF